VKLNKLLKDLKTERVQGSSAVLNYSNFDYWVNWDDIVEIVENHKQPSLNENQQIVLDVLKKNANQGIDELIVGGITYMNDEEIDAIELSSQAELFQVLVAFAEWGLKNEQ